VVTPDRGWAGFVNSIKKRGSRRKNPAKAPQLATGPAKSLFIIWRPLHHPGTRRREATGKHPGFPPFPEKIKVV